METSISPKAGECHLYDGNVNSSTRRFSVVIPKDSISSNICPFNLAAMSCSQLGKAVAPPSEPCEERLSGQPQSNEGGFLIRVHSASLTPTELFWSHQPYAVRNGHSTLQRS